MQPLSVPVVVALALFASFAQAQPKPALVQDRDEPGRSPYQQLAIKTDCVGFFTCNMDFGAVPAGMRLVVTQVTVETSVSDASGALFVRIHNIPGMARAAFVVAGPFTKRFATVPVAMYVEAGQALTVQGTAEGGTYADWFVVTMAGYFVALP